MTPDARRLALLLRAENALQLARAWRGARDGAAAKVGKIDAALAAIARARAAIVARQHAANMRTRRSR